MVGMEPIDSSDGSCPHLFCVSSMDVEKNGYRANMIYRAKVKRSNNGTFDRIIKLSNYSLEDDEVVALWESSIPFNVDVKLQPLGLFSLNITSCDSALQMV
ncbi:hypothetical protein LIER_18513 [Lithospermum erythrorhizon]|uniref:Uncharacterized protein n=1 Tax=Lithospermum erythrorhizon TaxID=34254 RepID=A0AAV3QGX0_LITER